MTQKQNDLLLKDLCARLPYGVKYMSYSWNYDTDQELPVIETLECVDKDGYINHRRVYTIDDIKPYLFPLSSMTDYQKEEHQDLIKNHYSFDANGNVFTLQDFYCKNHLDYRGFIPEGLAIDATGLNIY